jgi:hypothetical protein
MPPQRYRLAPGRRRSGRGKSAASIQFPDNVEPYEKIDVMTIAAYDADRLSTSSMVRTISE